MVAEGKYGQILGVHIVGPHASDIILAAGVGLTLEATWTNSRATIAPHPTLGEALMEAALDGDGHPAADTGQQKVGQASRLTQDRDNRQQEGGQAGYPAYERSQLMDRHEQEYQILAERLTAQGR